ncbi:restriction endonuclease [Neisseria sp. ZJ106]|uniref:Restriction endonuclease n=1 Tax=Neisseria lisongii TaxID=2912188 RepID=A0ABY7RLH7_9NEIS|nr:restriction endonuclease [Neisseria lisongii]MCF7521308.1 restriction endonuclease [Neisseria lisongii]WCL72112.1 restriction endonuclease [Neisseria lisongii]
MSKKITNLWTQKSIDLANQKDYLDQLFRVYPMSVNLRREVSADTQHNIQNALNSKNHKELIRILLKQEVFPIKDSYVAYLKRDKTAIDRNPATVARLGGMLLEMGFEEIINKTSIPKETNRQIGPLFKRWVDSGILGAPITDQADVFMASAENMIFNASDAAMKHFAEEHLGYNHNKGLDFIARFNHQYIIGEAKFLSDFGGHQNAQFADAVSTMQSKLKPSKHHVHIIAILDGVLYIPGKHKLFEAISAFKPTETVLSAILLRDYLYSL